MREPEERRVLAVMMEPETVVNSRRAPVMVVLSEKALEAERVRPCPAVYVVSESVPQENLPVVASQARVWLAASQSVRPEPWMEVAM